MTFSYIDQVVNLIESNYKVYKIANSAATGAALGGVDTVGLVENCDGFGFVALP